MDKDEDEDKKQKLKGKGKGKGSSTCNVTPLWGFTDLMLLLGHRIQFCSYSCPILALICLA